MTLALKPTVNSSEWIARKCPDSPLATSKPAAFSASLASCRAALYAMLKRQSSLMPFALQSRKSLSATAKRFAIPWGGGVCGLSQPFACHCFKLIFVSDQIDLHLAHDTTKKRVAGLQLTTKVGFGIDGGVEFPAQRLLRIVQCSGYFCKAHVTADHHVDVAAGAGHTAGPRP